MNPDSIQTALGIVSTLELLGNQGGNSRLYSGILNGEQVVYKCSTREDAIHRVNKEFRNLVEISSRFDDLVPKPLALDSFGTGLIMTFEKGDPPKEINQEVLNLMAIFLEKLVRLGDDLNSRSFFEPATDNIIEDTFGINQLTKRYEQISNLMDRENLRRFRSIDAILNEYRKFTSQMKSSQYTRMILSPSDFGIHNILVDGSNPFMCKFVDFEYFGWDRPEKLVSDTILHPKNKWQAGMAKSFLYRAMNLYDLQEDYVRTLLYFSKLNWSLIAIRRLFDSVDFSAELTKLLDSLEKLDFANKLSLENTLEILGM